MSVCKSVSVCLSQFLSLSALRARPSFVISTGFRFPSSSSPSCTSSLARLRVKSSRCRGTPSSLRCLVRCPCRATYYLCEYLPAWRTVIYGRPTLALSLFARVCRNPLIWVSAPPSAAFCCLNLTIPLVSCPFSCSFALASSLNDEALAG